MIFLAHLIGSPLSAWMSVDKQPHQDDDVIPPKDPPILWAVKFADSGRWAVLVESYRLIVGKNIWDLQTTCGWEDVAKVLRSLGINRFPEAKSRLPEQLARAVTEAEEEMRRPPRQALPGAGRQVTLPFPDPALDRAAS